MADTNVPTTTTAPKRKSIGVSMVAPWMVFADGEMVEEHATEDEAEAHYARLRLTHLGKTGAPPPRPATEVDEVAGPNLSEVSATAVDKGYHLFECVPITADSKPTWMIHKGFYMKFFDSFEELLAHVKTIEPWKAVNLAAKAL